MKISNRSTYSSSTNLAHFDLVSILHKTINKMNPKLISKHVHGHQERSDKVMSKWEYINTVADAKVKSVL